jgi:hypothetical protein
MLTSLQLLMLLKKMPVIQEAHAYSGNFEFEDGDEAPKFTHSTYVFLEDSSFHFARCANPPGSYDPNSLPKSCVPLKYLSHTPGEPPPYHGTGSITR